MIAAAMSSFDPRSSDTDELRRPLLAGRYELLEPVGGGATAEVFRARDHRLDRIVAVKVLRAQYGKEPSARARFEVEARSAAGLNAPNIVQVYDFGTAEDGSLFIVMRFVDGPSLRTVLAERGARPQAEAVEIGRQVAEALAVAHGRGMVHRDVTPGNVLIEPDGTALLTDFGIVKAVAGMANLTETGTTFGTAHYLSPEQARGSGVGPKSDLYALGAVLYHALTGRPPFSGDDPVAISYRHAHEPPASVTANAPGTDPELAALVMQLLEKDPDSRPLSAREVADRLTAIGERLGSPGIVAAAAPPAQAETIVIPPLAAAAASPWSGPPASSLPPTGVAAMAARDPELGVAPGRPSYEREDHRERSSPWSTVAFVVLALVLLGLAPVALFAFLGSRGGGDDPTATPSIRATPTVPVVIPPVTATPDFPTPTPIPATPSPEPITPEPITPEPVTPEPPVVTPEPPVITPEPPVITPEPPVVTPEPPVVTPGPPAITPGPPAPNTVRVRIPDESFTGDFPDETSYHGRSASWVYGQGTAFNSMSAPFSVVGALPSGPATLQLIGLDGENEPKNLMRVTINGTTIYEGGNPLPNDFCCGTSGPGNWGTVSFAIPAGVLAANNTLTIVNLESNDCTSCPKYVMLDRAIVDYTIP